MLFFVGKKSKDLEIKIRTQKVRNRNQESKPLYVPKLDLIFIKTFYLVLLRKHIVFEVSN